MHKEVPKFNGYDTYPYQAFQAGKRGYGVPFHRILHQMQLSQQDADGGVLKGGSGRPLRYEITPLGVSVQDLDKETCKMVAAVDTSGIAYFNLSTILKKFLILSIKHPDFFAADFIRFAINYFRQKRIDVKACMGEWWQDSVNFQTFMSQLAKGETKEKAARSTWSGKQFIKNGFTYVPEDQILIEREDAEVIVRAYFYR